MQSSSVQGSPSAQSARVWQQICVILQSPSTHASSVQGSSFAQSATVSQQPAAGT